MTSRPDGYAAPVIGWPRWMLGAWVAVVLVTGAGAASDRASDRIDGEPDQSRARSVERDLLEHRVERAGAPAADGLSPPSTAEPAPPAAPVEVRAPSVGVVAPLVAVGKTPDGALAVPGFGTAGWYRHSAVPGSAGSAVLVGHVDSTDGPDVFHRISELRPGDEVAVGHADGARSTYEVVHVELIDKDALPIARIFDDPPHPELRLITCGGAFDRRARSYESNVIVYARSTLHGPSGDSVAAPPARTGEPR